MDLTGKRSLPIPKIFVGYSDLTTLLTSFTDQAKLVTFHGPMVGKDFASDDGVDWPSWQNAVSGTPEWEIGEGSGAKALAGGEAEGVLYGGCLSILVAALGTPHDINTTDTILFIEDIAAKPYQIDRMLMQLKLAGKLKDVRGIIFGEMLDCRQSSDSGLHARRSRASSSRRSRNPGGLRPAFGTCLAREYHAAVRREGPARSRRRCEAENSGVCNTRLKGPHNSDDNEVTVIK